MNLNLIEVEGVGKRGLVIKLYSVTASATGQAPVRVPALIDEGAPPPPRPPEDDSVLG